MILIIAAVTIVAVFLDKKEKLRTLSKWKYEAFVFFVSWMSVVLMSRYPGVYAYSLTYYFMPYERGFGSRGLLGALTAIIGGEYITQKDLINYVFVLLTFAYLFFSVLIVRLAKKESDWWMGVFWVALYLLSPLTFLEIYDDARPDLYLIIIFIISVILINKKRCVPLIPALCVVMLLLNETSSVFFVAPLLALLLYCYYREKDPSYLFAFISSAAFTCVVTLVAMHRGELMPIDRFFAHMTLHTDSAMDFNAFRAEYGDFASNLRDYAYWFGIQIPYFKNHEMIVTSILYFILIIPFVILFAILWKALYKKLIAQHIGEGTSLLVIKFLYWIMLLSSCGAVICMLAAWDYLRFSLFIMIAALAIMFTLIHKEKLTLRISDLYLFTPPKRGFPILPFAILLYMGSWGTLAAWGPDTPILINLANVLRGFFNIK